MPFRNHCRFWYGTDRVFLSSHPHDEGADVPALEGRWGHREGKEETAGDGSINSRGAWERGICLGEVSLEVSWCGGGVGELL